MTVESLPTMRSFRHLHQEHQEYYQELGEPKGSTADYWEGVFETYRDIPNDQKPQKIVVLTDAIKETPRLFPEDGGVILRRMYYHLGYTLERVATFDMENESDTDKRQRVFLSAAECYITADEIFGIWSGYADRAINCLSAAGRVDLAQQLTEQAWGGSTRVVPEGSEDSLEVQALMKRSEGIRIDEQGNRIYDIYLPPAELN